MVFWQLTIDANDPRRLARFWAAALGWTAVPPEGEETWQVHYRFRLDGEEDETFANRLFDPRGRPPALFFQRVPETKSGKNRLHLDLYPTGRDDTLTQQRRIDVVEEMVTRLSGLGARVERRTRCDDPGDEHYYVVMHDPEGNEFCVS